MINPKAFPVLEFDDNPYGKVNPYAIPFRKFTSKRMVITFFPEVLKKLLADGRIVPELTIPGENPVEVYRFTDDDVLITLGQVGCPACGSNLDLFHALGADAVMFCGGGGVLDADIEVGQLLVVEGAIRDEGFSYQYVPASRYIYADPGVVDKIADFLDKKEVSYLRGLVWTTDAIFRETEDRIARRKEEGAKIVEMEQAGNLAVAQCRGFAYGALIYGGDDVSRDEWDQRNWRSREGIRYDMVMLCKEMTELIAPKALN